MKKITSTTAETSLDTGNGTNSQSDAVKSENDPYAFADFSEM